MTTLKEVAKDMNPSAEEKRNRRNHEDWWAYVSEFITHVAFEKQTGDEFDHKVAKKALEEVESDVMGLWCEYWNDESTTKELCRPIVVIDLDYEMILREGEKEFLKARAEEERRKREAEEIQARLPQAKSEIEKLVPVLYEKVKVVIKKNPESDGLESIVKVVEWARKKRTKFFENHRYVEDFKKAFPEIEDFLHVWAKYSDAVSIVLQSK